MIGWGALGRADHPWSAEVEQGCSTLPRFSGRLGEPSLPWETDGRVAGASLPEAARAHPLEAEAGTDFEDGGDDRESDEGDEGEGGDED